MPSSVYLIRDLLHPRFKIGKANNIISRIRSFGLESINFKDSMGLLVESEADAFTLERILHCTFRDARLQAESVLADGGKRNGASEWFDLRCWNRLVRFLDENQDLYPHTIIRGSALVQMVQTLIEGRDDKAERKRLIMEQDERRATRRAAKQVRWQRNMRFVELQVVRIKRRVSRELERLKMTGSIVGLCESDWGVELVLAGQKTEDRKLLWGLEPKDTTYHYDFGGGTVIGGISQIGLPQGQLCCVGISSILPTETASDIEAQNIVRRVFSKDLEWLRQLPAVSMEVIETIHGYKSESEDLSIVRQVIMQHLGRNYAS